MEAYIEQGEFIIQLLYAQIGQCESEKVHARVSVSEAVRGEKG